MLNIIMDNSKNVMMEINENENENEMSVSVNNIFLIK